MFDYLSGAARVAFKCHLSTQWFDVTHSYHSPFDGYKFTCKHKINKETHNIRNLQKDNFSTYNLE
jgi:hypothetical protein